MQQPPCCVKGNVVLCSESMKRKPPPKPTKAQLDRLRKAMAPMRNFFEELGRIGGKLGAEARWANVSEAKRREGARKAALARWKGKSKGPRKG